jgi:hypothetical protein
MSHVFRPGISNTALKFDCAELSIRYMLEKDVSKGVNINIFKDDILWNVF